MAKTAHFSPALFDFLRELKTHNNREWFMRNKSRYEGDVKTPMINFIGDFGSRLRKISANFVADPRPVGGSMFRIYRDVRFAADKRPYKTAASARFPHAMSGRDVHAPGFYLHLEPDGVFGGGGLWHPEGATLTRVRDAIIAKAPRWKRALNDGKFNAACTLHSDSLTRPPKGYDPDHPLIEELKRRQYIATADFSEPEVCRTDFIERYTELCATMAPLMKFLTTALELPW